MKLDKNQKISDAVHYARLSKGNNLMNTNSPILAEWDYGKNDITPYDVTPQTHTKVWWLCKVCGFSYLAEVGNRYRGSGCPCCAGHIVVSGINDLASLFPNMIKEWDFEKNGDSPETIHYSAKKNVWWKCKFGHSYQASPSDRYHKAVGCPVCSKYYRSSFAEQAIFYYVQNFFEDATNKYKAKVLRNKELDIYIPSVQVAIEYDGQRYHKNKERDQLKDKICMDNGIKLIRIREPHCPLYDRSEKTFVLKDLSFDELSNVINKILTILVGIHKEVNVKKDKNNILALFHNTAVNDSISIRYPDLAKEWADENGSLKPENLPVTKTKKCFFWKCNSCGHVWKTSLAERIRGSGCPVCKNKKIIGGVNDLSTTHSNLALEWHPTKNLPLTPQDVTYGSNKNIYWKCSRCGHEWRTRINRRVNGNGCPKCVQKSRRKKVFQYDAEMKLVSVYSSLSEASARTGYSTTAICNACNKTRGSNYTGGYYWSY